MSTSGLSSKPRCRRGFVTLKRRSPEERRLKPKRKEREPPVHSFHELADKLRKAWPSLGLS